MATRTKAPSAVPATTELEAPAKAVAAPAAKKAVAKKAVAKKAVAQAPAAVKSAKQLGKVEGPAIDQAQRANYIEVAAYYIAQRRGFTPGDPEQDYLNAAAEVDQLIAAGHFAK